MYTANQIAIYIVNYCNEKGFDITNLRLQKLLYFVQASFFSRYKKPCFSDDFEAWEFGPVVAEIYHKYKFFGSRQILFFPFWIETEGQEINKNDEIVISKVLDYLEPYPTMQLVDISHHQDPWMKARESDSKIISKESISEFFS